MGFLSPNFQREGAGVPKNDSQKNRFALFFELLFDKFWDMIKLNLLFTLFCLPIVTIPASIAAMTSITVSMSKRNHYFLFSDFKNSFKKNWQQSTVCFIIDLIILICLGFSLNFYYSLSQKNPLFWALFFICISLIVLFCFSLLFVYPLITCVSLSLKNVFKNSILLAIICFKHSLCGFIGCGILILGLLLFFPLSIPLVFIIVCSLISFISSFITIPCIEKYVLK